MGHRTHDRGCLRLRIAVWRSPRKIAVEAPDAPTPETGITYGLIRSAAPLINKGLFAGGAKSYGKCLDTWNGAQDRVDLGSSGGFPRWQTECDDSGLKLPSRDMTTAFSDRGKEW